jgi:hypothetical protein
MRNPYEEATDVWDLFNAGEELANSIASDDPRADAIDRLTVALYRVGAALVSSSRLSQNTLSDSVDNVAYALKDVSSSVEEIAKPRET